MRIIALLLFSGVLLLAVACGSDDEGASPSPTPTAPSVAVSETPVTPASQSPLSLRGEEAERVADSEVQRVTWDDGTQYEETLPTLMLRTIGRPDASHGRRVVATWLGDTRWQVTIYTHMEDRTTDPPMVTDLRGEFFYDEASKKFEAANGRAAFALTGRDPCPPDDPDPNLCPLDKEIVP
jgi:hypothetical protein